MNVSGVVAALLPGEPADNPSYNQDNSAAAAAAAASLHATAVNADGLVGGAYVSGPFQPGWTHFHQKRLGSTYTSRYVGVVRSDKMVQGKAQFRATCRWNNKRVFIGYFNTEEQA